MNKDYRSLLPVDFNPSSKVWVYQADRLLTLGEALELEEMLEGFIDGWRSHGDKVKGYGNLFFGQFLVLMADETETGVGGCSTDSSVRFVKEVEQKLKMNMFNRQNLAFLVKDKVQLLPLSQLNYALDNGFINGDTIYFNNVVLNKQELIEKWMIPVKDSWLGKKLKPVNA